LQKVRSRSERVFSPREELAADDDRWGSGGEVAAALAKRACTRKRCSTEGEAARVLVGVVTAAARKGAEDLARSRERKEARPTRLVDAGKMEAAPPAGGRRRLAGDCI
jgi:hypothetical protein